MPRPTSLHCHTCAAMCALSSPHELVEGGAHLDIFMCCTTTSNLVRCASLVQAALQQAHATHDPFQAAEDMLAKLGDPYTRVIATTMTSSWQARTTGQVLHVGLGVREVQVRILST